MTAGFGRAIVGGLVSLAVTFLQVPVGIAQDPTVRAPRPPGAIEAHGTLSPLGPPAAPPVRVEAGRGCVVDLRQRYTISGTLSGAFEIDYRILVAGPCEAPPVPGKHDEAWIAHGTFAGTMDGSPASAGASYTAKVEAGGLVSGRMVLGGGLEGELEISGRFSDGALSYTGWVR